MLDGEQKQEIGKIVEDRTRPFEHANDSMRRTLSSLKGEFAQLHEDLTVQAREQHEFRHETFDNFHLVKTDLRALNAESRAANGRLEALEQGAVLLRTEMHERFGQIDDRFGQIDERFGQIDEQLAQISAALAEVITAVRNDDTGPGDR